MSRAAPRHDPLATLIRKSRLLDPVAKRHWLAVLPEITPRDRARLAELLSADPDHRSDGERKGSVKE